MPSLTHHFGLYYSLVLAFCGFIVPLLVLVWIYMRMYRAALKNSERTRRHSISAYQTELILTECPDTPETGQSLIRGKTKIHRKRSSNSSISSLFFREEGRAVKTGAIVIASFITSWMPYYTYKIFESIYCYFPHIQNFVLLLALSSTCTMPFIYVYRNETAKKEALKVVCWWRTDVPSTPTSLGGSSIQHSFRNGHSPVPVRIVQQNSGTLYSYTTECSECGAKQLVSSLKPYRPISAPVQELRNQCGSPVRRGSGVSFRLAQFEKSPLSRCHLCLRQDSASSASSEDPLVGERFRYPMRPNVASVRLMRHRLSNGSVNTRSDSLASTNSSVLSYSSAQRWPRRCSTFSTDSCGTYSRKSNFDELHDIPSMSGTPKLLHGQILKRMSVESEDDSRDGFDTAEYQTYASPLKKQLLYSGDGTLSSNRFIWEIEECDVGDEDSIFNDSVFIDRRPKLKELKLPHSREMEDIEKYKNIRRARMFKKRFSQQEFNYNRSYDKRISCTGISKAFNPLARDFCPLPKFLKEEENRCIRIKETNPGRSNAGNSVILENETPAMAVKNSNDFPSRLKQSDL